MQIIKVEDPDFREQLRKKKGENAIVLRKNRYKCFIPCTSGTITKVKKSQVILMRKNEKKQKGATNERIVEISSDIAFSFEA